MTKKEVFDTLKDFSLHPTSSCMDYEPGFVDGLKFAYENSARLVATIGDFQPDWEDTKPNRNGSFIVDTKNDRYLEIGGSTPYHLIGITTNKKEN